MAWNVDLASVGTASIGTLLAVGVFVMELSLVIEGSARDKTITLKVFWLGFLRGMFGSFLGLVF